ncbi:HAMP domain-containing histidine kinase [Leifsonia sp. ZF2019]|uniref:sensor histidine kinase n=1 Tax=Leifsonia sp. ZF2019 TaxID=2781978 RepID=UPI001CBE557D|nr:HAMP domain-containing sensor histidine kinase [Leifsonia sp. ZF2019]UAJ79280.1 HAMP domain-containing histidine kinase [Leifsonia sp. ZF2019]
MIGRPRPHDPELQEVRRASRMVGLQLAIASGALVVVAIGVAFLFVLDQLRPAEVDEPPKPGEHKIYIDTVEAMVALIVVGVLAVGIAGAVSMVATRRAVRPLGRALQLQRDFVADASHELRTPLAVLDARLQVLQRGLAPDDPSAPAVAELREDARTMIDVVNDLLLAADPEREAAVAPAPMRDPVARAVESLAVLAGDAGVELVLEADDVRTTVPPASLQRCATALVDNALAHSPSGGRVTVTIAHEGSDALLAVADQGSGIAGIDPTRIFDRFARAQPAAPRRSGAGFGIGLALVREIAARHGGSVAVDSTGPSGTVLVLRLPAA